MPEFDPNSEKPAGGPDPVTEPVPVSSRVAPEGPITERIVIPAPPSPPAGATGAPRVAAPALGGPLPFDPSSEPDEWPAHGPAKGFRINWLTAVLLFLLVAGGGIWGGAALQRSQGTTSGRSALASELASRFAGRTGAGAAGSGATGARGAFGGRGGAGDATAGTVTEISGSILYVTNSSGNLVEVTISPTTTVTRNAKTTISALQPGDTVIVQGSKSKNGDVTATSISDTAEGVSAFGGF